MRQKLDINEAARISGMSVSWWRQKCFGSKSLSTRSDAESFSTRRISHEFSIVVASTH